MGLLSHLMGNATEADVAKVQAELAELLASGERVVAAFKVFRDLFVFTEHRLIIIDKQGLTGSKILYHSILFRSITQFAVETAGTFDADCHLKIWISGGAEPLVREFKRGTDIIGIQKHLAQSVFAQGARPR